MNRVGYIDSVKGTRIVGWACDRDQPNAPMAIEILASNGRRIVTIASLPRDDVRDAGYGNGHHGFDVDVAPLNLVSETVVVRFADTKAPITTAPISLDPIGALLGDDMPLDYARMMHQAALEVMRLHAEARDGETTV